MIEHLETELLVQLKSARRLSVAVALMKDYGLETIERSIPTGCERRYVLGIDLPTTPSVFRELLKLTGTLPGIAYGKIYNASQNYHPKVYIIEKSTGELLAFVGSANATRGGFGHNIEMNIKVSDQIECQGLLLWFDALFNSAEDLSEEFIEEYESLYRKNKSLSLTQRSNTASLIQPVIRPPVLTVNPGQFFRQSDFDAFDPHLHFLKGVSVVNQRGAVRDRMIELAEMVMPQFENHNINDLHLPNGRGNYTSQHFHSRGNDHIPKDALWLNFGKSHDELNRYNGEYKKFVNHARIQIILRNTDTEAFIGIWLYLAKPNWSIHDRTSLKGKLAEPIFVQRLYDYVLQLGGDYWISLDRDELEVSDLISPSHLRDFLRRDNFTQDFIIGRNYDPNDSDLSEENIVDTVLSEFEKLYKIYDLIRHRG